MAGDKETIKNAIRKIAKGDSSYNTIIGKVVQGSVSGAYCDVQPVDGALIKKVRLNAHTAGLVVTPADDSFVLVTLLSETDSFVSQFSDIKKITLDVNEDVILNEGKNDGLIKINDLTDKLNALKNDFNAFVLKYNAHIHITTATPGMSPTPGTISATVSTASQTAAFNKNNYENTKIKH